MPTNDPTSPRDARTTRGTRSAGSRPKGRSSSRPTGYPRGTTPNVGRSGARGNEFPGPILGGQVVAPTRRELRRARRRRRRPGERILRALILLVVVVLVVAGLGYGYFRYQWGKVSSAPCSTCVAAASGAPYNVLLIGSDSRVGETAAEAQQFGNQTDAGGQRSDTIKIVRVDPATGTASSLSIPRDTYVTLSGVPASTGLASQNKINAAFGSGPDALIQTIENTFGIPINHYIVINFFGLEDAVNALGGIKMDIPYPVRDQDCSTGTCTNNAGLNLPTAGCQQLDGAQALALSRSRYYQYYANGQWNSDPTSDIGRITRQNLVISAALDKAKSTYNPFRINTLLSSVVHDFSKDNGLTATDLFSLAERYHAFSGSQLQAYTLPTVGASSSDAGDVEVVQPDEASAMIAQFLGGTFGPITTPPVDAYGNALTLTPPTTVPAAASPASSATPAAGATTPTTVPANTIPSYDPRPC
jgi:LCP family protein required for cell wall assembly